MEQIIRDLRKWNKQGVQPIVNNNYEDCRAYVRQAYTAYLNLDNDYDMWKEAREKAEMEQSRFGRC